MRGLPHGAPVTLTLAPKNGWGGPGDPRRPKPGEYLETEAGSAYRVEEDHGYRVDCIKYDPALIGDDEIVHPMWWVPRGKRRRR